MDKFASKIDLESSMSANKSFRQHNINDDLFKQRTYFVHQYVARWLYEADISFNAIQNNSFRAMMKAVGRFGPGYKEPSQYQLSEPLLKEEVSSTKDNLRAMFASMEWDRCKLSKTVKGNATYSIMLNITFWNGLTTCLKVFALLERVLRLVDGDPMPSMGFLYGELKKAKKEIKLALKSNENSYRPIIDIIDSKAKDRLDTSLHLMA
ncbi:hypothetical protein Dsin_016300 [Dipteronia sinensis]|uniref:Uncharacterized protein n=1 Tax=Dipteronia sinensis TaxID=43782 RepID=A0AAE0E5H9_9ROSI|nr:hypothetical protein Dsin_016300 [Dipteronia sinensis]